MTSFVSLLSCPRQIAINAFSSISFWVNSLYANFFAISIYCGLLSLSILPFETSVPETRNGNPQFVVAGNPFEASSKVNSLKEFRGIIESKEFSHIPRAFSIAFKAESDNLF